MGISQKRVKIKVTGDIYKCSGFFNLGRNKNNRLIQAGQINNLNLEVKLLFIKILFNVIDGIGLQYQG